jgi:hypothetical protein
MTTNTDDTTWHELADQLTDHHRQLLENIERQLAAHSRCCDPVRTQELLTEYAYHFAGSPL